MKTNKKQGAIHKEILECYNTEIKLINGLLKTINNTNQTITGSNSDLKEKHPERDNLINLYKNLLKNTKQRKKAHQLALEDVTKLEEKYTTDLSANNQNTNTMNSKTTHTLENSDKTTLFFTSIKKRKESFQKRLENWATNIRLTYNEIYSA